MSRPETRTSWSAIPRTLCPKIGDLGCGRLMELPCRSCEGRNSIEHGYRASSGTAVARRQGEGPFRPLAAKHSFNACSYRLTEPASGRRGDAQCRIFDLCVASSESRSKGPSSSNTSLASFPGSKSSKSTCSA